MSGYPYMDDLARRAQDRPEAPALVLPDRNVTWGELDLEASGYARRTPPGDDRQAVELAFGTGEAAAVALHALPRIGRYLLPLDPGSHDAPDEPSSEREPAWVEPRPESIRTGMLTSGSSGEQRLVPLTFANHTAAADAAGELFDLTPEDRWLACLPFHHIGGLSIFTRSAHVGFPVVVSWPFDAAEVIEAVERHRATAISLVPTMLRRLLDAGWEQPDDLRFALLGGATCPQGLQREALDRGIPIAPTFGMTETCSQICTLLPSEVEEHLGTVGRPIPGAAVEIRGAGGVALPNGEIGRIRVKGAMVAREHEDWLETGDLGSLDAAGYLTVAGRADDMIVTGGENVAPAEIEQLLLLRNDIAEAVVVGVPDPGWGERVVAAVITRAADGADPDPESLRAYLRENLAPFKVPKSIAVVAELPRIGPGKVDKGMLRDLMGAAMRAGEP